MKRFPPAALAEIDKTKYVYIRAGTEHRFIPIWVVVVDGRVLVRPWNDKTSGWYRAFQKDPRGAIMVGEKEVTVNARKAPGTRLIAAMDAAYAAKYTTKANLKYVKGFATGKRQATTLELFPA